MTAHGSEEIAVAALQKGAASYVPKRNLARDLVETVQSVLTVTQTNRDQQRIMSCLDVTSEFRFLLTRRSLSHSAIHRSPARPDDADEADRQERPDPHRHRLARGRLVNALEHGNLELRHPTLRDHGETAARVCV